MKKEKTYESSIKQVELSYLKEEIKYIKGTLDILLKKTMTRDTRRQKRRLQRQKKIRKSNKNKLKA